MKSEAKALIKLFELIIKASVLLKIKANKIKEIFFI